jgi:S-adenosylmethionine-diacylgycerolhomoserine-N-methlytransferase
MTITNDQAEALQRFYRWQARIYDATRWSFLFGRQRLLHTVVNTITPRRILEVGCGTGATLRQMAKRFPHAHLTGMDLSSDMLARARRKLAPWAARIELQQHIYSGASAAPFDLIVFSYSLSMMNPGWENALLAARADLSAGGVIAVVDFADSRSALFRRWMARNHVRMDGQLLPVLHEHFNVVQSEHQRVYRGWWRYLLFIGRAK